MGDRTSVGFAAMSECVEHDVSANDVVAQAVLPYAQTPLTFAPDHAWELGDVGCPGPVGGVSHYATAPRLSAP